MVQPDPTQTGKSGDTTAGTPQPPRLIAPIGTEHSVDEAVTLAWEEVADARAYWLQIAQDPSFDEPLFESYVGPSSSLTVPDLPLTAGSTLYWRMRTKVGEDWGPYGEPAFFRIGQLQDPKAQPATMPQQSIVPVPVSPIDGQPVDGSSVTFSWMPALDADSYAIQISQNRDFTNAVFDATADRALSLTVYDILPEDGTTFYWRVRGGRGGEWDQWGPTAEFRAATDYEAETHTRSEQEKARSKKLAEIQHVAEHPAPVHMSKTSAAQATITLAVMLISFAVTILVIVQLALNMN